VTETSAPYPKLWLAMQVVSNIIMDASAVDEQLKLMPGLQARNREDA
jgi:hypothetical protein